MPNTALSTWEDQIKSLVLHSSFPLNALSLSTIRHFKPGSISYLIYRGAEKERDVSDVLKHALVITTYDTLRVESSDNSKRRSKKSGLLQSIKWYRVVLDEGKCATILLILIIAELLI